MRCFCKLTECADKLCPRYKYNPPCYRQHEHRLFGRSYFYEYCKGDINKAEVTQMLKQDLLCQYDIDDLKEKGLISYDR